MRTLIQKLADASAEGTSSSNATALVVGAGQGTDLALLRRLGAERLILVEADPHQADLLSQRIDPTRGEQAWALAVTPQERSDATLRVVNQPQHSSLFVPQGLTDYFRNLAIVREITVPARSLADIVASLDLDAAGHHVLVLDAPGQAAILAQGTPSALLQRFHALVVRGSAQPLYDGDVVLDDLVGTLAARGFDRVMDDAEAIFPHQAVLLVRNDLACGALALQERVRALEQAAEEQAGREAQHQAQVRTLTGERDVLAREAAALGSQLEAAKAEAAAATGREAEHRALVQTLTRERDDQTRAAADLKARLETEAAEAARRDSEARALVQTLTQERDAQARAAADLKAKLEAGTAEATAATRRDAEHQAQVQALIGERDAQAKLAAERHAQIQKLSQEQAAAASRLADTESRLATRQREFDDLSKLAGDRHSVIQRLRKECEEQIKIAGAMTGTLDHERKLSAESVAAAEARTTAVTTQIEALTAENGRMKLELAENRNVVALSVRMQALREADLKDLQERYQVVHQRSEEQHKLLSKLADRLRVASGYFHQISVMQESQPSRPMLVNGLGDAPAPRKPKSVPAPEKVALKAKANPKAKAKVKAKPARKVPAARTSSAKGSGRPAPRAGGKTRRSD